VSDLICAAAIALSTLFKIQGADIWWHIRTGRWIWETRSFPETDPFSFTAPGPWNAHGGLAQLFFYGLDTLGGADALVWGKVALVFFLALALLRLAEDAPPLIAGVVVGLWAVASSFRLVVQPHLFSFLGFALLLLLLRDTERRCRASRLWWALPLVFLWGNFHRGVVLAPIALILALLGWALHSKQRRLLPVTAVVFLACLGAASLNQGGLSTFTSSFEVTAGRIHARYLPEWRALDLSLLSSTFLMFSLFSILWAGAAVRRRRFDLEVLLVLATWYMSFSSLRFIPYAAMAMIPGVSRGASEAMERIPLLRRSFGPKASLLRRGLLLSLVPLLVGSAFWATRPRATWGSGLATWRVPVGAAAFLRSSPPPGRMWHSFNLGGYLLYALAPTRKVFIDGRNDQVYPLAFFEETMEAHRSPAVLEKQIGQYRIGILVLENRGPTDRRFSYFHEHPDWVLVYWDDDTAVLVRRTKESEDYLRERGYPELRVTRAYRRLERLEEDHRREAFEADLLRNARETPHSMRAHYLAAVVHRSRGRVEEYRQAWERTQHLAAQRGIVLPPP
jgi:hypothetical protein